MNTIKDAQFGDILDYQRLREGMSRVVACAKTHHIRPPVPAWGILEV